MRIRESLAIPPIVPVRSTASGPQISTPACVAVRLTRYAIYAFDHVAACRLAHHPMCLTRLPPFHRIASVIASSKPYHLILVIRCGEGGCVGS